MSINERKGRAIGQKDSEADASQEDNVVMETAMNSDGNGGSSKFIVRGHIIDKPSGKAASDVRVQAFVKHKESNFCPEGDSTQSDAEGFYQIEFSAATFKENDLECDGPVLVVKAYNQKDSLIGKSKSVRIVNRETELNVDVTLYRVDVSVLDVNNKPVPKIIVKAFDRDLRKPQPLGACETNEQGKCYIDYSLVDFQKGDLSSNKTPWLIVEARKEPDGAALVSQEFRKAESIQKVNLVVTIPGTVISEWQRLNNIIPPLLKGQGTPPSTGSQSEMDNIVSLLKGQPD